MDFERLYIFTLAQPSSWCAPNPTLCSSAAIPSRWTKAPEFDPITRSSLTAIDSVKAYPDPLENAVKTQIRIAVSVYVLVSTVRKRLGMEASLYQVLQISSVTLFEKMPILQAFQAPDSQDDLSSTLIN